MTHIYEILDDYTPIPSVNVERYDAFCQLLAKADPPDLKGRGTRPVMPGSSDRFKKWLTILMLATRERIVRNYKRTWWELP